MATRAAHGRLFKVTSGRRKLQNHPMKINERYPALDICLTTALVKAHAQSVVKIGKRR